MDTNGRNYCFNKFVSISIHSWLNPGCECVAVGNPQFKMLEKFDERNRGPIVNINGQVGICRPTNFELMIY